MTEQDAARLVKEREEKMLNRVEHARARVELCKCTRWDQECINRFKRIVILAKEKEKSFLREVNVKLVLVKKYQLNLKLLMSPSRKELFMVMLSLLVAKVIKYPMH